MILEKDNPASDKIVNFPFPYFYLLSDTGESGARPDMAVFLGVDFKNLRQTLDLPAFIRESNRCLDYMRRECVGCTLYYKPHPGETDEYTHLDLRSFEIIPKEENEVAEVFFWKRLDRVKYVFSTVSTSVWSAYNLGLNSYTFTRCVEKGVGKDTGGARDYYDQLPESFFINDYSEKLYENKKTLRPDPVSEAHLLKDLEGERDVWLVAGDPGMLVIYVSFAQLIRKHFPGKKVNMILIRHHRWSRVKESHYKDYFDSIVTFPRGLYSFRPRKFIEIIRTIRAVKNFELDPKDTLLLFANTNVVENCLLSFFPNKKIAIQYKSYFETNYELRELKVLRGEKARIRPTIAIFSWLIEPLLGLHRSVYIEYADGKIVNIVRYILPASKIYDRIYLLTE